MFIEIPEPVAASRLRSRGVSDLWPNTVPIENVLENFSMAFMRSGRLLKTMKN